MATSIFDVTELMRAALQAWWTAESTISALGTPVIAADDGSPATGQRTDMPSVVIRLGDASIQRITNHSRIHAMPVTFQVFHNTRKEASDAAAPLDTLLCDMADDATELILLDEGRISGVNVGRFSVTQLSKMRWRADREVEFTITIDRQSA